MTSVAMIYAKYSSVNPFVYVIALKGGYDVTGHSVLPLRMLKCLSLLNVGEIQGFITDRKIGASFPVHCFIKATAIWRVIK
jgi:hypothetical protein